MSPSYDCVSSILLCAEDNESIFGFEDEEETGHRLGWISEPKRFDLYGDFLMDFPLLSDECVGLLVERECEHLPRNDYVERVKSGVLVLSIRKDAIDWIYKAHAHYNFGPLSACLAVNYLDRFLSVYEIPQGKAWMTQLLSVACLSLAAKMEETEVPLLLDLQVGDLKYVFEARTIQRMELLVLSTLKWRMQSVTPFSFIDYFLHKFNFGNAPTRSLVTRSMELILSSVRGTEFLEFRPSEIAAATALVVLAENQLLDIKSLISCCIPVAKDAIFKCYEMIQDLTVMRNVPDKSSTISVPFVPHSPIGVLEAACLSYKGADITVGSQATCHQSSPVSKRRKTCITLIS